MAEIVNNIVIKLYQKMQQDKAKGMIKRISKSMLNMISKASYTIFKVLIYLSIGIIKNLHTSIHSRIRKLIVEA
jgi:hypothetical protein